MIERTEVKEQIQVRSGKKCGKEGLLSVVAEEDEVSNMTNGRNHLRCESPDVIVTEALKTNRFRVRKKRSLCAPSFFTIVPDFTPYLQPVRKTNGYDDGKEIK